MELMSRPVRIHDGILGALFVALATLSHVHDGRWIYGVGLVGAVMFSSMFTGFCPVHFALRKVLG
jgi:hypothetical protein